MHQFKFIAISMMALVASACVALMPTTAHGQQTVIDLSYTTNYSTTPVGNVGQYSISGAPLNAPMVTGLGQAPAIAVSGSNMFVTSCSDAKGDANTGTIGEYNAITGAVVNASLVTGLDFPTGVAVSGSNLYVANLGDPTTSGSSTIGKYTLGATPGTVTSSNPSLVSGVSNPANIAVSADGKYLFVVIQSLGGLANSGTVSEYNTATGATVNATLVPANMWDPIGITLSGSELFVGDEPAGKIGEYTLGSTPGTVASSKPSFITFAHQNGPLGMSMYGLDPYVVDTLGNVDEYTLSSGKLVNTVNLGLYGYDIAVVDPPLPPPLPEPGSISLIVFGMVPMLMRRRRSGKR